ncbi:MULTISPECIES: hypothetical protein [unclassified Agarivorans]|uniref:hypothetical protein n=1 Tax=unclassified Agarivorans TaxID=2636026 RepID=UPI0026E2E5A9|nr:MULTISPECIES: hypothetical protein [unclassified Agarivorans]MDO6684508.1 hypothetical protein [Agarivorans sp. 3_MG-2023]MDO6714673.1 hypothetical protein [Agarivorans sp. 2_MG-2023]
MMRFFRFVRDLPSQGERVRRLYSDGYVSIAAKTIPIRREASAVLGMSTLDIIACGLGAVAFIAILNMLIKVPIPPPLSEDFILAEVRSDQSGIFGFAIRHDNGDWVYVNEQKTRRTYGEENAAAEQGLNAADYVYSVGVDNCKKPHELEGCGHTVAHLLLYKPAIGRWEIEPFFRAFRQEGGVSKGKDLDRVRCFYWTRDAEYSDSGNNCTNDFLSAPAKRPGVFATEITH